MRHEQGRRHALSCDVAQQEEQVSVATLGRNQIAIVPADHARGLVLVMYMPIPMLNVRLRQQPSLHTRSKLQVALESALLVVRQVVEAELHQGISQEPVLFDGVVALGTNSVRP